MSRPGPMSSPTVPPDGSDYPTITARMVRGAATKYQLVVRPGRYWVAKRREACPLCALAIARDTRLLAESYLGTEDHERLIGVLGITVREFRGFSDGVMGRPFDGTQANSPAYRRRFGEGREVAVGLWGGAPTTFVGLG